MAKIRNRHIQVPHLTQDTVRENDKKHKKTSQEVSYFPAGDTRQQKQTWQYGKYKQK